MVTCLRPFPAALAQQPQTLSSVFIIDQVHLVCTAQVDRGDLFVTLARCIHEDRLKPLDDSRLKDVVGSLLHSFKALQFYPDCTEALLVAARLRPQAMGPAENALISEVENEVSCVVYFVC